MIMTIAMRMMINAVLNFLILMMKIVTVTVMILMNLIFMVMNMNDKNETDIDYDQVSKILLMIIKVCSLQSW